MLLCVGAVKSSAGNGPQIIQGTIQYKAPITGKGHLNFPRVTEVPTWCRSMRFRRGVRLSPMSNVMTGTQVHRQTAPGPVITVGP